MSQLSTLAARHLAAQTRFAHLNAFISRPSPAAVLSAVAASVARQRQNAPPSLTDKNSIAGHLVAVKDNICTAELPTTAASGILRDFTSPYDATVIQQLSAAGAVLAGKTNMDEFGMGSHSTSSHFGPVKRNANPQRPAPQTDDKLEFHSAGGSSGGSAVAVATGQCHAALGTDTGGSVRLPAAYSGIVGFKPSYGRVSRWGVIAYANSLDCVGVLSKEVRMTRRVFEKLDAWDGKDPTSLGVETRERIRKSYAEKGKRGGEGGRKLRVGIPLEYNISSLAPSVRHAWIHALRLLASAGHTLHSVSLPSTPHALSAYYILAPAEASSNLAKFDGVRFGTRAEGIDGTPSSTLFAKTRGEGFGEEVQRRILLGAFSLSAEAMGNYFIKAQEVRRCVQRDFDSVFKVGNPLLDSAEAEGTEGVRDEGVDIIISPTTPTLSPTLSSLAEQDPVQAYMNDVFTVPASLAGLPAISVPVPVQGSGAERSEAAPRSDVQTSKSRKSGETAGIQIIGQFGDDALVLDVAEELEILVREALREEALGKKKQRIRARSRDHKAWLNAGKKGGGAGATVV